MKHMSLILLCFFVSVNLYSQTKDTFILKTNVPTYDAQGNLLMYNKTYNHAPTREDSLDFFKQADMFFFTHIGEYCDRNKRR